jgi:hypothetical protein
MRLSPQVFGFVFNRPLENDEGPEDIPTLLNPRR